MNAQSKYQRLTLLYCLAVASLSSLHAGVIKGKVCDISVPNKGLPLIEVVMETVDNKITTALTNTDGDYSAKVDVQIGSRITGRYHGSDYGVAITTFVLNQEVIEKNVYLFREHPQDPGYYGKVVDNTTQIADISTWTGGLSGLWKFSDSLGLSTLNKVYLSKVLNKKDPKIATQNPDILLYDSADPDTVSSLSALVQAALDRDHRLPTQEQVLKAAPEANALPKEVIADIFGTKLAEKPEVKAIEIDQLGRTWGQDVKKKTEEHLATKEFPQLKGAGLMDNS